MRDNESLFAATSRSPRKQNPPSPSVGAFNGKKGEKFCIFANILYFMMLIRPFNTSQIKSKTMKDRKKRSADFRWLMLPLSVGLFWFGRGCSSPTASTPPPPTEKWQVFRQVPGGLINNHINSIYFDNSRRIWIATNDGVSYFSGGAWASLRDSLTSNDGHGGPPSHRVSSIVQGKDRSMWFGLTGGGVQRYNPLSSIAVWTRYTGESTLHGLISDLILSMTADVSNQSAYGEVWFTSALGISRFIGAANETGTWRFYTHDNTDQIPSNQVWASVNKLDDNSMWFGTQSGGAVSVEYGLAGLDWTRYPLRVDSKINSVAFDLHNTVWFGTQDGAESFNTQSSVWTSFRADSAGTQLPPGPVNAVVTNHQNVRWFGTNSGLARFNDTTWTQFTRANSPLPSDTITALAFDFNQNIWIGTLNGVAVYNGSGVHF